MVNIKITNSPKPEKKYQIIIETPLRKKTLHIGAKNMEDYTLHKDPKRRASYISRHRPREDWNDPFTAGYWAFRLLWNTKDFNKNKRMAIADAKRRLS